MYSFCVSINYSTDFGLIKEYVPAVFIPSMVQSF